MSDNADTIRALLPSRHYDGVWFSAEESEKAHAALDALLAENQRLRDALAVYADPRNWAISRDDLSLRVVAWIGPGAERAGMPNAMETAEAALAAVRVEDER